jgi:putative hydrolase of the HAD superfamily
MHESGYTTLFLDVGGVFLTNGWDHHMREKAAQKFLLNYEDMNSRHALTFDTYEIGKITLDEYLKRVVFYQSRSFSLDEFKEFMFTQSQSYPEMIQLLRDIKSRYSLKTVVVSNEGRELMEQRIQRFRLKEFIDFFICSGFVGLRKPDEEIYRIALDSAQVDPKEVIYIDDRSMLVEIGNQLGLQSIQHISFEQTKNLLENFLSDIPYKKDK